MTRAINSNQLQVKTTSKRTDRPLTVCLVGASRGTQNYPQTRSNIRYQVLGLREIRADRFISFGRDLDYGIWGCLLDGDLFEVIILSKKSVIQWRIYLLPCYRTPRIRKHYTQQKCVLNYFIYGLLFTSFFKLHFSDKL